MSKNRKLLFFPKLILLPTLCERETGLRKHHARHAHVIGRPVSIQELDNKNRSILSDTPISVIERETGLEPATPTLARSCSTN